MSEATNFQTLWKRLTDPHPSITGLRQRRRMQILSSLTLGLLVIVLPLTVLAGLVAGNLPLSGFSIPILLLVTYGISRTTRPEIGAYLLVFGQSLLNISFVTFVPEGTEIAPALVFLLLPVLLSTLILPAQATIADGALTVVMMILLPIVNPWLSFGSIIVPFVAITLLSALAGITAYLREQDFGTIQTQADDLSEYSDNLEKDVELIRTMSDVARTITGTRETDDLLEQVVNLIVERFDYYHAQVFLVDEDEEWAVLRQSTGTAGRELLSRGHKLAVGSQSVIGQVTSTGQAVIASDTDVDAVHRRNELLPHTRSEMALPLKISGRTIGALDIQSVNPNAFRDTDVSVLQTMADQLAIAIENARLFEHAQRDLADIEMLNRQLTGDAWGQFLTTRSPSAPMGYQVKDGQVKPLPPDALEEAMAESDEGTISLPLTVRGETIGVLDVKPQDGKTPDSDTQVMLEAVAERVALALDSARLGEQSQRQATRDQILSRLSAELQSTTNLDAILRVAAREASSALRTSRGFVYLTTGFSETAESEE